MGWPIRPVIDMDEVNSLHVRLDEARNEVTKLKLKNNQLENDNNQFHTEKCSLESVVMDLQQRLHAATFKANTLQADIKKNNTALKNNMKNENEVNQLVSSKPTSLIHWTCIEDITITNFN